VCADTLGAFKLATESRLKRERAIDRLRKRLLRRRMPRLQMSFILIATGLVGFVSSFLLLHLGLTNTAIRYPLALSLAYVGFLTQLRIWIFAVRRRYSMDFDADPIDIIDVVNSANGGSASPTSLDKSDFPEPGTDAPSNAGGSVDLPGPDLGEGAIFLIPIAIALAGLVASIYVVYIAPALFAELILDGVIVASLYRRLRHIEPQHWLAGAARRTWIPFVALLLTFSILGFLVTSIEPNADSIGDLF
jgi:hypothetical protein